MFHNISDPKNKNYIIGNGGIQNIEKHLSVGDDNIILSCITTLMYLYAPEIKTGIIQFSFIIKYVIPIISNVNHVVCGLSYLIIL